MKIPRPPHRWAITPREAIEVQRRLAARLRIARPRKPFRLVAGVDAAFPKGRGRAVAAVVLWDLRRREVVETRVATLPLRFPYVPGLLSFREAPAILAALRRLKRKPDVLLCDAHGLAHPRRFGLACHLGVLTRLPAIGCAKSRLVGEHKPPGRRRGSYVLLRHEGEAVGAVLRTQTGVKPVYVSVGHAVDLETAVETVLACAVRFRLPEPTRLADRLVARASAGGAALRAARAALDRGSPSW